MNNRYIKAFGGFIFMSEYTVRTDLAVEAHEMSLGSSKEIQGVTYNKSKQNGNIIHFLDVFTDEGAKQMGKPKGKYCTIEIDSLTERQSDGFEDAVNVLAAELTKIMPPTKKDGCALVVGLGNRDITPDAIGPLATESTLVTKHLKEHMPEDFAAFSPVAVISPGVLGTSGIESASYIKSICDSISPNLVIVVDALAARSLDRLCRTVQITDTGITPGSGVGNNRCEITTESLGIPVVAVGVPTVVDIGTILADLNATDVNNLPENMIVTPRNIDTEVVSAGRLVGYAMNLALHDGLTIEDIDLLVG